MSLIKQANCFKVVRNTLEIDKFESVTAYGKWRCYYEVGITTHPPVGKLFVYRYNLQGLFSATNDVKTNDPSVKLFVANAKNIEKAPENAPVMGDEESIPIYWKHLQEKGSVISMQVFWTLPFGTMFADEVTLLREVYRPYLFKYDIDELYDRITKGDLGWEK